MKQDETGMKQGWNRDETGMKQGWNTDETWMKQGWNRDETFCGVRVTRSLVLCVCFVDLCLSFCTFSFDHCAVFSSSIYRFLLPFWYLFLEVLERLIYTYIYIDDYTIKWKRQNNPIEKSLDQNQNRYI
jgi:hypothetical protein